MKREPIEKLGKDSLDALAEYVENPSPTTVLALSGEKLAKNKTVTNEKGRLSPPSGNL